VRLEQRGHLAVGTVTGGRIVRSGKRVHISETSHPP
jgi:hypothetical protein